MGLFSKAVQAGELFSKPQFVTRLYHPVDSQTSRRSNQRSPRNENEY